MSVDDVVLGLRRDAEYAAASFQRLQNQSVRRSGPVIGAAQVATVALALSEGWLFWIGFAIAPIVAMAAFDRALLLRAQQELEVGQ